MNFWDEIKIVHMMVFFTRTSIADENNVFFSSVIGGENGKRKPKLSTMKTKKSFYKGHGFLYKNLVVKWFNCLS